MILPNAVGQHRAACCNNGRSNMKPATIDELRTMEARIKAGAVGGNPTCLLFLVIWLQATSGIDFDDINRSQPVELLDGWIRFVYKLST